MPGSIIAEAAALQVGGRRLLGRHSAAASERGAKLVGRHLVGRRLVGRHLVGCRLVACRLLARGLPTRPWRRVVQLSLGFPILVGRVHGRRLVLQTPLQPALRDQLPSGAVRSSAIAGICGTGPPDRHRSPASWADCSGRSRTRRAVAASAAAGPPFAATVAPPPRTWSSRELWLPNSRRAISDGMAD